MHPYETAPASSRVSASIVGGAAITAGGAGINRSGVKGQGLFKASRRLLEASKKSSGKQQDLTVPLLDEEDSCDGERKASISRQGTSL